MTTSVNGVYTKAQQDILDVIDGKVKRLSKPKNVRGDRPAQYKRHSRAIDELKALNIIEKGPDNILRRVIQASPAVTAFTRDELSALAHSTYAYADSHYRFEPVFNSYMSLYRKIKLMLL